MKQQIGNQTGRNGNQKPHSSTGSLFLLLALLIVCHISV